MATLETQQVDAIIDNTRRRMLTVGGAALAGLAFASLSSKAEAQSTPSAAQDTEILNFALNLEYLEAQFYNLAVYGVTIDQLTAAQGGPISITGGQAAGSGGTVTTKTGTGSVTPVPFAYPLIQGYATETALEEGKHVSFLQSALGSAAVAMPNLDLYNSFVALGMAAIGAPLDPFQDDAHFLLGAYIFEDTGVSAYHGAAPYIFDKTTILPAAVGIHAVEAYHAALVRTSILGLDAGNLLTGTGTAGGYSTITQQISAVRTALSSAVAGSTPTADIGITLNNVALNGTAGQSVTIVDDNQTSGAAEGRTTAQILSIVTDNNGTGATGAGPGTTAPTYKGLFFPNGLNGSIS